MDNKVNTISNIKDRTALLKNAIAPEEKNPYGDLNNLVVNVTQNENMDTEINQEERVTYFSMGNEQIGFLEADLIAYREKGQEQRYLALKIEGFDLSKEPAVPQTCAISISNKEDFDKLKAFFAQLNWND